MRKFIIFILLFIFFSATFYTVDKYTVIKEYPRIQLITPTIIEPINLTKDEIDLGKASEKFYREYLEKTRFNGAMLVAKNGKIVFEKYAGYTHVLKGEPLDSSISFHLASVSKTFTAMGILKLWQDKLLDINDEVRNYLQNFPYEGITIRDLLSHRSGLPNYVHFMEKLGWDSHKILTNNQLLEFIIQNRKFLNAGRHNAYFDYCNTNYAMLALIIEKVSKTNYSTFMQETFFKPLGMKNSFVYLPEMQENVLPSYKFNNQLEKFNFLDAVYGDKNIYSTVRDMLKWDLAISGGKLFSNETLAEAFKGYSYEHRGIRNYGLGWRLYEMPSGKKIIYHNGWWHGNNTVFSRLPSDSTTIIVLGNKFNRSIYQAKKIIGIYEGYGLQFAEDE